MPNGSEGAVPAALEIAVAWATIGSAIIGALGLLFIAWQVYQLGVQTRSSQQVYRSEMFLHLAEQWSRVLQDRYKVLQQRPIEYELFEQRFANPAELFASEEWGNIRKVLNFYEIVGLMIHQGYVTPEEAFVLVSVDQYTSDDRQKGEQYKTGEFYKRVEPYLLFLRRKYRRDIYVFFDLYLAQVYHQNYAAPFLPDSPALSGAGWWKRRSWRRRGLDKPTWDIENGLWRDGLDRTGA